MRDRIEAALKSVGGQYVEVHVEEASSSAIRYRGNDLEEIGRGSGVGGNVRALDGGGWGFASFNDLSNLESKIHQAIEQARVVGGERIELAETPPVVDHVPAIIGLDPGSLTLAEKEGHPRRVRQRDDGYARRPVCDGRLLRRSPPDGLRELRGLLRRLRSVSTSTCGSTRRRATAPTYNSTA